jgi:hypothetical protein
MTTVLSRQARPKKCPAAFAAAVLIAQVFHSARDQPANSALQAFPLL